MPLQFRHLFRLLFLSFVVMVIPSLSWGQTPVNLGPAPLACFRNLTTDVPLSGGQVATFAAGTSTPQATWTDSSGSVMNSNPVILASDGCAQIWFSGLAYKITVSDSSDSLQFSVDNFSIGVFAGGNNQFSGNNTFSGTTNFTGPVNLTVGGSMNGTWSGSPTFSGTVTFSGSLSVSQLTLTIATGNPPLVVTSTTVVPNLNVEVVNGVAFPASPSLHSVPVITATNVASWKIVPDCVATGNTIQFTQATNAWSCGTASPGAVDCPASTSGYALTYTGGTWSCTEIIPPVIKVGTAGGNYDSASASFVNVDGTNLEYVVTIPTGSNLVVQADGTINAPANATSVTTYVAIADGGTQLQQHLMQDSNGDPSQTDFHLQWVIAGDGMSHTITLQYKKGGGSGSDAIINNTTGNVPTMLFTLQ